MLALLLSLNPITYIAKYLDYVTPILMALPDVILSRLRALIIDDEEDGRKNLCHLLGKHCPEIEVIGQADSAVEARTYIAQDEPDLLFLDIRMPGEDGFALLDSLKARNVAVLFVTAYDEYAIKAIKAGAADFILKPVSIQELKESTERIARRYLTNRHDHASLTAYWETLAEVTSRLREDAQHDRIALPTWEGVYVEELSNIVRFESDDNYTVIVLNSQERILLAKPLKEFERGLDRTRFIRVHNSHIINIAYIKQYKRDDGGRLVLRDGSSVPVSRRRASHLIKWLNRLYR